MGWRSRVHFMHQTTVKVAEGIDLFKRLMVRITHQPFKGD